MAKKSRTLSRSNSEMTATRPILNLPPKEDNINRDAIRVSSRRYRSTAGLYRHNDKRLFRLDFFRRRILRDDFALSRLSANSKHNFATVSYEKPIKEPVCRRRRARREVLFARSLTGKGARARQHSWTQESQYSCK